jgi:putative transposase
VDKLSNYYAQEYDLVAVEDLNLKGMLESAPVETALSVDTPVSAKRVMGAGSPALKQ